MTNPISIRIRDLSKLYKLGLTHAGSFRELVHGWTSRLLRKPDQQELLTSNANVSRTANGTKSNRDFWALRNINLDVAQGEILGIVGRNGAGKSTLLKILSKVTFPTEGQAELYGRVGSLLEVGTGFHPELTGRENVFMNGTILGMTRAEIRRNFDAIVAFSGVEQFIDTPVKRYSTGMNVRLGFAVAAHLQPEILIVDEVLAVGDLEFQEKCLGKMEQVSSEGRTVIFVSHNMGAIRALCSRAILLAEGQIIDDGNPATIIDQYASGSHSKHSIHLVPDHKRMGTGEARFRRVESEKQAVGDASHYLMTEPIKLRLALQVFKRVANVHFHIFLKTPDGTVVTCSDTTAPPTHPSTIEVGTVCVHAQIDAHLLPGSYRVGTHVLRGDGTTIDWVDDGMSFTVDRAGTVDGDYYRWHKVTGFVRPNTTWSTVQQPNTSPDHYYSSPTR